MRAVICRTYGDYADMLVEEVPRPPMNSADVRIRVDAAGVSFANILAIAGKHQNRADLPFIPGTEVSGTVIECGSDTSSLRAGDRVIASVEKGAFAEEVVAPAHNVFTIPDQLSCAEAVSFCTIYAMAYMALVWRANLQPGETLLVHGAGGASGLAAVEIGAALGASVIATAGSSEKLEAARLSGAHHVIDYSDCNFREAVLDITDSRGADIIFDPIGGDVTDVSLRCIAPEGRLIVFGFAAGRIPHLPANILLVKNIAAIGVYWGYYMGWSKQQPGTATRAKVESTFRALFDLYASGSIHPKVHRVLPLEHFAAALDLVRARQVIGKIALTPI